MWGCLICSEQIEDDFDVCWNCQASKDGLPSESYVSAELPRELENLRERLSNATDEELSRIVNVDFKQYGEEALVLARMELARRNLSVSRPESVEESRARVELARHNLPTSPTAKLCSSCKAVLEEDAKFCAECRTPVAKDNLLECPNCQKTISSDSKFCKYCAAEIIPRGKTHSVSTPGSQRTKANNLAASGAILAVISGIAFYWGQSYTSNWGNAARAGLGNLVGQQDSTYQLAQMCLVLGLLGILVGVILFIVGLAQR